MDAGIDRLGRILGPPLFAPDILKVTFLAKSLRTALAVLVLFVFYVPQVARSRAAVVSILVSLVLTIGWSLAGDPFGLDSADVALVIPLIVIGTDHLLKRTGTDVPAPVTAASLQRK
ncbi:hypothetical protein [Methylobacterium oryzisoli]|uniref:hypothetical protein n=1 Tax=Methylobacterium oryzisoli TaxID=3385502 RepID=UPI00389147F5